jgi:hypothetical protein
MKAARPTLAFGKESLEKYKEVNRKLFDEQLSNKDLFFIAVGFGVHFAQRIQKFERASTGPRTELTDEDLYLLQAVAFEESDQEEELPDEQNRNEIAVQFAEGGIRIIHDLVKDKTAEHARAAFLRDFQKTLKG